MLLGKSISFISRLFNLGAGATWPGEIALWFDPRILPKLLPRIKKGVIIVAGTNGKTTTTLMVKKILEDQEYGILHNESGANLLNGIVSAFLADGRKTYDYAVFEVDENTLPEIIFNFQFSIFNKNLKKNKTKYSIVLLNLFRDQLDRYGEVDTIANNWLNALETIDNNTTVLINADDPHLAFIGREISLHMSSLPRNKMRGRLQQGSKIPASAFAEASVDRQGRNDNKNQNIQYFGIDDKKYYLPKMQHATDTIFCPSCGNRLTFEGVYFSHLGDWMCTKCGFTHPASTITSSQVTSPLEGVYNMYNTLAATLVLKTTGIDKKQIQKGLQNFTPAFGRMEDISYKGKDVRILLSKNPTGFNESLRTVLSSKHKGPMMLLLNDRIPDGTDVSWIWDVDFEVLAHDEHKIKEQDERKIIVSGDRVLDTGLRLKYSIDISKIKDQRSKIQIKNQKYRIIENLRKAVDEFVAQIKEGETGWILATYSAMLDVRKILTGKKIL